MIIANNPSGVIPTQPLSEVETIKNRSVRHKSKLNQRKKYNLKTNGKISSSFLHTVDVSLGEEDSRKAYQKNLEPTINKTRKSFLDSNEAINSSSKVTVLKPLEEEGSIKGNNTKAIKGKHNIHLFTLFSEAFSAFKCRP